MDYSPYAPPAAPPPGVGAVHQPLGWKTTATATAIALSVGFGVLLHVVRVAIGSPPPKDLGVLALLGLLSLATQAMSLIACVVFLVWMHQAARNAQAFGRAGLEYTPGWCVGWWFVPFASMWKPYQALREIFRASLTSSSAGRAASPEAGLEWQAHAVPATFPLWWSTYLASGFVGLTGSGASIASVLKHEPVPAFSDLLLGLSLFLSAMAAIGIIAIIRELHRRQEATWGELSAR